MVFVKVLALVFGLLPASRAKTWLLGLLPGYHVAPDARIAPVVLWRVGRLDIAPHVALGPGTIFRGLALVRLGPYAEIGQLNWITTGVTEGASGELVMGADSALTSRHYVDCTGGVRIGRGSTVGGVRSTLLTHGLDTARSAVRLDGIEVGENCLIHSNVVITPGRQIADRCIVAAGAVVAADLEESEVLYGGVPARPIRERRDEQYFVRERGRIDRPASTATAEPNEPA
jgi:acetyltransferase-like isoleucine patch superfamily enzyme